MTGLSLLFVSRTCIFGNVAPNLLHNVRVPSPRQLQVPYAVTNNSNMIYGNLYEFTPSAATPTLVLFDVRREVPYFYDTLGLTFLACVATCDQESATSWWSAALAHTITCAPTTPHPSVQTSSPYHGQ
jgi:hypothetical protein